MKFTVLQENIKKSISYLQKAIPTKPNLPILASILIEAKNNSLILSATDLYFAVKSQVEAVIEKEGRVTIPGEILKQLLVSFNPGPIIFEKKENHLLINANKSKLKIPITNSEEFPDFPKIKGQKQIFNLSELKIIDNLISFSASRDLTRPVLTSILMIFNQNNLEVVATDGFRLSRKIFKKFNSDLKQSILLPFKSLSEVYKIAQQKNSDQVVLELAAELKQVKFIINETEVFIRLIEGEFPPYQKIIPDDFKINFRLDKDDLLAEIKRANILAKDSSNIIKFKLTNNSLSIKSHSPSFGQYEGKIEVNNQAKIDFNEEIAFNAKYLLEFLNNLEDREIEISINEALKPVMFKSLSQADYQYIVMPFRANG